MSDERIAESPDPPRCPVCATGFAVTPGETCPGCGRAFASPSPSPPEYDFRLRTESRRLDGPAWMLLGFALSCGGVLLAVGMPGVIIVLAMLLVPTLVRTARLRSTDARAPWIESFLAALGVSLLTGVAAGAACFAVCLTTILVGEGSLGLGILIPAFLGGGVTALVVFVWLTIVLWPRADRPERAPGED